MGPPPKLAATMTPLSQIADQWEELNGLLDEALALPPAARAGWLAALQGDAAQHRETMRSLLDTQASIETDDFLITLPSLPMRTASLSAAGSEPQAGDLVGPYRLIQELGRGGMGLVWLAERSDGLASRRVALKLPHLIWGQLFAERLSREREILAGLEHEHIARLYDAGIDALGRPYIAMQYVEGEPIDAYCRHHQLPPAARIGLLLQAMSAVAHAHARLVVHRDLKPGNVLVNAEGCVTLLDFGVAKLLDGGLTDATALTQMAGRALTPDYASPEQIRGEPLGTASDVYSLGVLAFELLAEVRPYRLSRGTTAELEAAIRQAEPPRASDVAAQPALKQALRGDLDAILARALKKDVAERYPSVDAFAADLQRHLRGEPVLARPDSAGYRLAKFVGRHRLAVGMGAALTLSVLAGSALSVWQAQVAREQERRATSEVRRQTEVRNLYIETMSRLSVLAAEQPEQLAHPGAVTSVLLDKLKEMTAREAGDAEARAAQLEAVMLQLNYDNRLEDSLTVAQEYVTLLIAQKAPPIQVMTVYATMGRTLHLLRRFGESEAVRRKALAYAPDVQARDVDFLRLTVLTDLSGLLIGRGRRDEALLALQQARALAASGRCGPHVGGRVFIFQGLYHLGFDDVQALQSQRSAAAEFKANGSSDPDELAFAGWHLGDALTSNGQLDEAETVLTESLGRYRQEYGRSSRNAVLAFGRLAGAVARRDPARATALIEAERLALGAEAAGAGTLPDAVLRAGGFEATWLAGDVTAALAPPVLDATLPPAALRDQERLVLYGARFLAQTGRVPQALKLVESLVARWPDAQLSTWPWVRIEQALAELQLAAGQTAAARGTADALVTLIERAGGSGGASHRAALSVVALATAREGDGSAATQALKRMAASAMPPFASPVERADCELRRAEALAALGRSDEAAAIARALLPELQAQHPKSPRLALAQRLIAPGS
ncbi:MAG: serine/threonine protein kinase [Rubrivivax sp.]|nr:MAG: serine/threonine protein kinase [Rubrivivax sp.]